MRSLRSNPDRAVGRFGRKARMERPRAPGVSVELEGSYDMTMTWSRSRREGEGVHELARDATLRLRATRAELAVRVCDGSVLVTREGDRDDHVLGPGDELRIAGSGLAVAWALSAARLVVTQRDAAGSTSARAPRREGAPAGA